MAKVSIIIPTKEIDANAKRCWKYCSLLPEFEQIILVDDSRCPGLPATKRNWAMKRATGDVFAFIDSDAYPHHDWLMVALHYLKSYSAVCGPGVLPPDAPFMERVADQVHKWVFCPYRVTPQEPRVVKHHPTFNLIVKREVATKFDSYLTGEDDKFCQRIPGGIFYHPDILVYHNRRPAFKPLWKQFGTFSLHKGHFARIAFLAWLSTIFVYAVNYVRGFFKGKL